MSKFVNISVNPFSTLFLDLYEIYFKKKCFKTKRFEVISLVQCERSKYRKKMCLKLGCNLLDKFIKGKFLLDFLQS